MVKEQKIVSLDFETHRISDKTPYPQPVCVSYDNGDTTDIFIGCDIEEFLNAILSSDAIIVAHNASFEANVIAEHYPHLIDKMVKKLEDGTFVCTKIYEQLIDYTRENRISAPKGVKIGKYSLANLNYYYFKKDNFSSKTAEDSWRLRYDELDGVPLDKWPQEAKDYSIGDSVDTRNIYLQQKDHDIEYWEATTAEYFLNRIAAIGFEVDGKRVQELEEDLLQKLLPNYLYLNSKNFICINQRNGFDKHGKEKWKPLFPGKDVKAIALKQIDILKNFNFYKDVYKIGSRKKLLDTFLWENIKTPIKTAKGGISSKSECLRIYATEQGKAQKTVEALLNISEYEKVLNAFVYRLKQVDTVIRTQYGACGSSNRTSSFTSNMYPSVNIQQMPRELKNAVWGVRSCFKARPGRVLFSIDYNCLELASAANMLYLSTGLSNMRRIINSGDVPIDMHSVLAAKLMSIKLRKTITYGHFVANLQDKKYKEFRQLAKPINLGFPGGIGYDTMRTLLATYGIYPYLFVINTSSTKEALEEERAYFRNKKGEPVRIRQTEKYKFELVFDELVELKDAMLDLYPDLKYFLHKGHLKYCNNKKAMIKNDFGVLEEQYLYDCVLPGHKRMNCTYTALCNNYLMQSPAAIGAKRAVVNIMKKYGNDPRVNILAFVHDEILGEVYDCPEKDSIVKDICNIMIDSMQTVLNHVRIAVEAGFCGTHWSKETENNIIYWKDEGGSKLYEKR